MNKIIRYHLWIKLDYNGNLHTFNNKAFRQNHKRRKSLCVYKNTIVYDKIMSALVVWRIHDIYWVTVCYFLVCDKIFGRCFQQKIWQTWRWEVPLQQKPLLLLDNQYNCVWSVHRRAPAFWFVIFIKVPRRSSEQLFFPFPELWIMA